LAKSFLILLLFLCCCNNELIAQKFIRKAGKDLTEGIAERADSAGASLISGIQRELTQTHNREALAAYLDSVLAPMLCSIKALPPQLVDSILNHETLMWMDSLRETIIGEKLKSNLQQIQIDVVGKSKKDVLQILDRINHDMNGYLADSTRAKVAQLRNELLGDETRIAIAAIMDTVRIHLVDSSLVKIRAELKDSVDENGSTIKKYAIHILIAVGVIALAIISLVWYKKMKYEKIATLLSMQINAIPDQEIYDKVTNKIQNEAITMGVEPNLRKVLQDNGLINNDAWKKGL
jgi:hypothetical protein